MGSQLVFRNRQLKKKHFIPENWDLSARCKGAYYIP
jgi:hypothetical protein